MRSKCRSLWLTLVILSICGSFGSQAADAQPRGTTGPAGSAVAGGATAALEDDGPGGPGPGPAGGAGFGSRLGRGRRFGPPGGFGGDGGFARMALDFSLLNLSEDQKNKIKATREKNTARAREIKQSLMGKRAEFYDLMFSDTSTNEQVIAKRDEIRALKDEQENLMLNDFLANRAVLTPEQRKKRAELKPELPFRKLRGAAAAEGQKKDK